MKKLTFSFIKYKSSVSNYGHFEVFVYIKKKPYINDTRYKTIISKVIQAVHIYFTIKVFNNIK